MTIKITEQEYHEMDGNGGGVCLACEKPFAGTGWVEPDAEGYECALCGAHKVCGVSTALMLDELEFTDA